MFEIIFNGGMTSAVVLKNGKNVYQGDADDAQEYVLSKLGVLWEQDQEAFNEHSDRLRKGKSGPFGALFYF